MAEYTYNGLGYRIGWHYDVDADGTVESGAPGDDPWYWFCYDERWRMIATYRYTDSDPKERFMPHAAGLGGYGGSSYVDSVAFRARDMNGGGGWRGASDGTLESRVFYCQNWRNDVVALWQGLVVEWVKYSSFGTPFGLPAADTDSDGDFDSNDDANISGWGADPYDVRADYDFDGDVDITDASLVPVYTITSGQYAVSSSEVESRRGYAGYENGFEAYRFCHVRNRVMDLLLERWTKRDPAGYLNGNSLLTYITRGGTVLIASSTVPEMPLHAEDSYPSSPRNPHPIVAAGDGCNELECEKRWGYCWALMIITERSGTCTGQEPEVLERWRQQQRRLCRGMSIYSPKAWWPKPCVPPDKCRCYGTTTSTFTSSFSSSAIMLLPSCQGSVTYEIRHLQWMYTLRGNCRTSNTPPIAPPPNKPDPADPGGTPDPGVEPPGVAADHPVTLDRWSN